MEGLCYPTNTTTFLVSCKLPVKSLVARRLSTKPCGLQGCTVSPEALWFAVYTEFRGGPIVGCEQTDWVCLWFVGSPVKFCLVLNPFTSSFYRELKIIMTVFTSKFYSEACKHYSPWQPFLF